MPQSRLEAIVEPSWSSPGPSRSSPKAICQPPACRVPSINKEWLASCRQPATPSLQSPTIGVHEFKEGVRVLRDALSLRFSTHVPNTLDAMTRSMHIMVIPPNTYSHSNAIIHKDGMAIVTTCNVRLQNMIGHFAKHNASDR